MLYNKHFFILILSCLTLLTIKVHATDFICSQKACKLVTMPSQKAGKPTKFHFGNQPAALKKKAQEEPSSFTTYDYAVTAGIGFLLFYLGKTLLSCVNGIYNAHTHALQRITPNAHAGPRLIILVPLQALNVMPEWRFAEWNERAQFIRAYLENLYPQYVDLNFADAAAPAA